MITAAKTTMASTLLVALQDPTGRKRASARRGLMRQRLALMSAAAVGGAVIAVVVGYVERRRRLGRASEGAPETTRPTATAAGSSMGPFPGSRPVPMDKLTASAERVQSWGADEPGFRAHLGFGVGGTIPADPQSRVGDAMPTGGGHALGGTVRGGKPGDFAHEIVTGAGEAISNSTTPAQNGQGTNLH